MILYLILSLSISLVVCIPFNNLENEFIAENNFKSVKREDIGRSTELLTNFINELSILYERGVHEVDEIFNDPNIAAIVTRMDIFTSLLARSLVIQYETEVKQKDVMMNGYLEFRKRFIKETSTALLNKLVQTLLNAYKKGSAYFYKALNDPDIQGILDHLGPFSRKLAESIIGQFKELVDHIDEMTKPISKREENVEDPNQVEQVKELIIALVEASKLGPEYFNELTTSDEFKQRRKNLGFAGNEIIDSIIAKFVEIFDHFEKVIIKELGNTLLNSNWKEDTPVKLNELVQSPWKTTQDGKEYSIKAINNQYMENIFKYLKPISKKVVKVTTFIDFFNNVKELIDRYDSATKEKSSLF